MSENIACFSTACAAVLAELHEAFPRTVEIDAADMQAGLVESGRLPAACAWTDETRGQNLVSATLDYLLAEGVVRCAEAYAPAYVGCVLTARGFTALQAPARLVAGGKETLAEVLRRAGRMTAATTLRQVVETIFQQLTR